MAIDRRREAAGGGPGRLPPAAEENGALPPGDAAASAPLGGRAGPGGGGDIQPLPAPHAAGGPHPSLLLLDYDGSVLPFLGGLGGGYQKTLVLLTWIPALFIGFSQFSDSFLLDQPNFWCRGAGKGAESAGVTATGRWDGGDLANGTSPPTTLFPAAPWGTAGPLGNGNGSAVDGGEAPPLPSPPDKGDNASNCDCHAWDYGIRTGLVQNVVSKWDLVCDNAWKVHVAKFSLLVGLIFGYLITGCIADWFGRRPVLLFSIIFILIFGLTVALSVNVTMFSTLRFFEGFCLAGVTLTLYALRFYLTSCICWKGLNFLRRDRTWFSFLSRWCLALSLYLEAHWRKQRWTDAELREAAAGGVWPPLRLRETLKSFNPPGPPWNRAVPPGEAIHDHDGGELRDHGRAVPHARAGRPVPGLAGAAGAHHLPLPAHAAVLVEMATHSSVLVWRIPGSLVGCRLWGHTESDTTEAT
ncbi:solute carrier family 22 member 23 isoform X3 [Ovis canadensis]|uniref:solute carrier family 22 member 23 isoform X3 n=1 Tax=Ovis canadensis TaxID=37174 RepID=UPI00375053A6